MKKKYLIIITILLAVFLIVFFLIRRTPYKVGELISGIEISKKNKVEIFEDEWGVTGDGISIIVFSLQSNNLENIENECINKGYSVLPIKEELPLNTVYNYISQTDTLGYYKLRIDKDGLSYNVVILDLNKNKLIVVNELF